MLWLIPPYRLHRSSPSCSLRFHLHRCGKLCPIHNWAAKAVGLLSAPLRLPTCVSAAAFPSSWAAVSAAPDSAGALTNVFASTHGVTLLSTRRFVSHPHQLEHNLEDCDGACASVFTATRAHSAACRCRNACEERRSSIHIQHKDRQRHSRRHVPAPLSPASGLLAHAAPVLARIHSHEPGQRAREPTPTRPVEHYQVAVPAAVSLPLHPAL